MYHSSGRRQPSLSIIEPVPLETANVTSAVTDACPPPAGARGRVHVVFSIDTMSVGGTEMNAIRTAERLNRERYRLSVVTLRGEGPLAERYERMGVPVIRFPIRNLYGTETVRQGVRLARFLRDERVSVVHCHDQYSNFFSAMAARLGRGPGDHREQTVAPLPVALPHRERRRVSRRDARASRIAMRSRLHWR